MARLANAGVDGVAGLRQRLARSSLDQTIGSIVYKAEEMAGPGADRVIAAVKAAGKKIRPIHLQTQDDILDRIARVAAREMPPGARRRLVAPVAAGGEYLYGPGKHRALVEAIEVTARKPPADVVRHRGYLPRVASVPVEQTRWEGVDSYVASRLGPVKHVLDALNARDRVVFTNLDIGSALAEIPRPTRIERLNLPISSYEKSLHLVTHADDTRTLVLGDFRGQSFLEHFQLLVRANFRRAHRPEPKIETILSPEIFRRHTLELRDFFASHLPGARKVDAVVVAYPGVFASRWKAYAVGSVHDPGPGQWRADLYRLPGGKTVAVLSTPGDFYGDLLGQELKALVDAFPSIRSVFFAGSGGSLHAREAYSLVLPATIRGTGGKSVPNILTTGSAGLVHESAISPIAETPAWLAGAKKRQVSTIDMEMGGVADALAGTGVEVGFGVVVTDFPAGQVGKARVELALQRGSAKQAAAGQLPVLIERYLTTGARSHDHPIEQALGKTIAELSRENMAARLAGLGPLSPDERRIFDKVRALTPDYVTRIPVSRLDRLVDDGILAKRQVSTLLGKKVTPFTPDSEDQLFRALDYTFGNVGFHDGDPAYGEVIVRLRPETWRARSWATDRAGLHAVARALADGPISRLLAKIDGRAARRLNLADPAQQARLDEARRIFSRWIVGADAYPTEMAAQAVELFRQSGASARRSWLEAEGESLRRLLGERRLGHLEGKILGALSLTDVASVVVPETAPPHAIQRLRQAGIPVEVRPTGGEPGLRSLLARLKRWLFVGPSEILNEEAAARQTIKTTAAPLHLSPGQRRRPGGDRALGAEPGLDRQSA